MNQRRSTQTAAARQSGGAALDMIRGAFAGAVATFVMDRVDWFLYDHVPRTARHRTWAVRPEHKDPAHVIASRTSEALGAGPIPQFHPAGMAVQYGIGSAPAALYGALRSRVPGVAAGRGLAYGLAMFILEDEIANPVAGFAAPQQRYPWQAHGRGLVSHLVYGFVTDLVLRAFDQGQSSSGTEPGRLPHEPPHAHRAATPADAGEQKAAGGA
jgi:hypothetical protein